MKEYVIDWETDYCEDDYPDYGGSVTITAENKDEAVRKFYEHKPDFKAFIVDIFERDENGNYHRID